MKGILLFGHGARNAEYLAPFRCIREVVQAGRPGLPVEFGFLELSQPLLEGALDCLVAQGARHIVVVPIFFAPGKHVLKDLPERVAAALDRHPGLTIDVSACVGEVPGVIEAMAAHALSGL